MRVVAGSRDFDDYALLKKALDEFNEYIGIYRIISGGAKGADTLGEKYAEDNEINLSVFKADWVRYGKSAGYKRNVQMANYSDALVAFWDGKSTGTKHMIDTALDKGLLVKVVKF